MKQQTCAQFYVLMLLSLCFLFSHSLNEETIIIQINESFPGDLWKINCIWEKKSRLSQCKNEWMNSKRGVFGFQQKMGLG